MPFEMLMAAPGPGLKYRAALSIAYGAGLRASNVCQLKIDDQQGGSGNQDVSLKVFRKDIVLELYNLAGQNVLAYNIYRCWPSSYQPLPELDASADGVAIQNLTLETEGYERDTSVQGLTESSLTLPKS